MGPVVLALEGGPLAPEHGPADLQGLLEPLEPLLHRREVDPEPGVLHVEPGRADPEEGPTARDHVEAW